LEDRGGAGGGQRGGRTGLGRGRAATEQRSSAPD
jgi:hypothetical protein